MKLVIILCLVILGSFVSAVDENACVQKAHDLCPTQVSKVGPIKNNAGSCRLMKLMKQNCKELKDNTECYNVMVQRHTANC